MIKICQIQKFFLPQRRCQNYVASWFRILLTAQCDVTSSFVTLETTEFLGEVLQLQKYEFVAEP